MSTKQPKVDWVEEKPMSSTKKSLKDIAEIDTAIKGLSEKNPWHSIRELALNF